MTGKRTETTYETTLSRPALAELHAALDGRLILPGDDRYDGARTVFYGGFERRPAAIALPKTAKEVAHAILLARESGLKLAVRSGGHSNAGHGAVDGGLVLDLRQMRGLQIDPKTRTAWAQSGLTAGEYTSEAAAFGLASGFGDTASVGLGGITLGGGVGYLVRKHGLTIDHLLAAEIVTADGQILAADEWTNPDLFWAIRGGGGNFGVATRFQFRLHEVNMVYGGMIVLPATPEVIAGFIGAAEAAPDELSTIANIMPAPPMPFLPAGLHGKLILLGLMVYAGSQDAGAQAVAPFRALAKPHADLLRPMRYPEIYPPEDESYHPTAVGHTMFLERVDLAVAGTILEYLHNLDAPMRVAQLRVLGGAMARVPAAATAFAHRSSRIMANLAAFYNGPEEKARREAYLADFAAAIRQGDSGAYVNFLGDEGPQRVHAAYPGETWQRLAAIKARYDPDNIFNLNQNIPPRPDNTR